MSGGKRWVSWALALALGALARPAAAQGWQQPKGVTLRRGLWTTIPLPEAAFCITANGGTLWVGGARGMLARSDDGGRTWRVAHIGSSSQAIVTLQFASARDGVAVGSPGLMLYTTDAGVTWQTKKGPPRGADVAAFVDPDHGVATFSNTYEVPAWHVTTLSVGRYSADMPAVVAAVALGPSRWELLLAPYPTRGPVATLQPLGYTADAGRTWHFMRFKNTDLTSLTAAAGTFWLAGTSGTGKQTRSFLATSPDGLAWRTLSVPYLLDRCTAQGCLAWGQHGWTAPWRTTAALSQFGPGEAIPEVDSWAAGPDTFCADGLDLRCTVTTPLTGIALAAAMRGGQASAPQFVGPECISCPSPDSVTAMRPEPMPTTPDSVVLRLGVDAAGKVYGAEVLWATTTIAGQAALGSVKTWRIKPLRVDGRPTPVLVTTEFFLDRF